MKEASPAQRPDGAPKARGPRLGWLLLSTTVAFLLAAPALALKPAFVKPPPARFQQQQPRLKVSASPDSVSSCPGEAASARVQLAASGFEAWRLPVQYDWKPDAGGIEGKGASVTWILSRVPPGTYAVNVRATVQAITGETRSFPGSAKVTVTECREPPATCPKLMPSCPAETYDDAPFDIKAIIEPGGPRPRGDVTHAWSLTAGRIVSGQGTPSVRINPVGLAGHKITATYEVGGYGLPCGVSCTINVKPRPTPTPQDTPPVTNVSPTPPTPTPTPSPTQTPSPSPSSSATPSTSPGATTPHQTPPSPVSPDTPVGGAYRLWPWLLLAAVAALLVGAFAIWGRRVVRALADVVKSSRRAPPPTPPTPADTKEEGEPRAGGEVLTESAEASAGGILVGGQKGVTDEVRCTVFAPFAAAPGDGFLVQAFAHLAAQSPLLAGLAKEAQQSAERRGEKALGQVERGQELVFHLDAPGLEVDEPTQSLVWRGEVDSAQFGVTVPETFKPRSVNCKVTVSRLSVPLGHVRFTININAATRPAAGDAPLDAHADFTRYRLAFISYASQDRAEVLRRVQMLDSAGVKYFQDLLSLQPGAQWEPLIYKRIDECDVFFLFWSTAAKNSVWVEREVRRALERKGDRHDAPPEIIPVPIEGPPPVLPPQYLSSIHFNDKFLYFIHGSDRKS